MANNDASCQMYVVAYPFVRERVETIRIGGVGSKYDINWRPGVVSEMCPPDDCIAVASGEGQMLLRVISKHKPGQGYPERVFYTRKWKDPDGNVFGNNRLHVATIGKFCQMIQGYGYDYEIDEELTHEQR